MHQHNTPSRKEIWKMFDAISPTYDRVNRLMTAGLDKKWRKAVASHLPAGESLSLLDCATGTGDQLFSLLERCPPIRKAVGVDLAESMLAIAREKTAKKVYRERVEWRVASITALPFPDESFECITISFGVRNVDNLALALSECKRVLKPNGRLLILETSLPKNWLVKSLHLFYLRALLPKLGGWVSKNRNAYHYLNKTAETFPSGEQFCTILQQAGFSHVDVYPLTFGAVSIYRADK
ncbi:MAG: bifunctional demethylmenaquinone methyltransferase/2-methoxy-6-polyprenyl-1,4-benzoquinol methylase UbiE [Chlamydiales bacterium]